MSLNDEMFVCLIMCKLQCMSAIYSNSRHTLSKMVVSKFRRMAWRSALYHRTCCAFGTIQIGSAVIISEGNMVSISDAVTIVGPLLWVTQSV